MARKQAILPLFLKRVDHVVEIDVRESIAVVREEHFLVLDVIADRPEPLTDVAPDAGIDQRHAPILLGLRPRTSTLGPEAGDDAIRVDLRAIVEEELLDRRSPCSQGTARNPCARTGCNSSSRATGSADCRPGSWAWECSRSTRGCACRDHRRTARPSLIVSSLGSTTVDFGNGNDELRPPLADVAHLLDDLVLDVPRQDEDVVGLGRRRLHRRVGSGCACRA